MKLLRSGIIKGGVCEKVFNRREKRTRGSNLCLETAIESNCFKKIGNKYQVIKLVKRPKWGSLDDYGEGDVEIGYLRYIEDVLTPLKKSGQLCSMSLLRKYASDIASFEFGMEGGVGDAFQNAVMNKKPIKVGYVSPHYDETYKKWNKTQMRGEQK